MGGERYGADGYVSTCIVLVYGWSVASAGNYPDVGVLAKIAKSSTIGYVTDRYGYTDTIELVYSSGNGDGPLSESVG